MSGYTLPAARITILFVSQIIRECVQLGIHVEHSSRQLSGSSLATSCCPPPIKPGVARPVFHSWLSFQEAVSTVVWKNQHRMPHLTLRHTVELHMSLPGRLALMMCCECSPLSCMSDRWPKPTARRHKPCIRSPISLCSRDGPAGHDTYSSSQVGGRRSFVHRI